MKHTRIGQLLAALAVSVLAACGESSVTGPSRTLESPRDSAQNFLLFPPKPLYCPTSTTQSTTDIIGPLGGLLSIAGTNVVIPPGALLEPVTMTLTVPASNYMEIDVSVQGQTSFLFEKAITIDESYARCTGLIPLLFPLDAWHWDPATKTLLEKMFGIDNKLTKTVTFTTIHLSGYVIAN